MVADALIYHPTVSHYLKFVATTVGRDKVLRTIQYFARFYAWYLFRLNHSPATIAPWTATKTQLGFIRKSMRLGKSVEHLRAAAVAYDAKPGVAGDVAGDSFLRYCTIGRQLGYAGYMAFDNLGFLDVAGIRRSVQAKEWQRKASQAWMAGLVFSVLAGLYRRYVVLAQQGSGSSSSSSSSTGLTEKDGEGKLEAKKLERERRAVDLQLLSDLCDLTVPAFALGYGSWMLDDGVVGIAGTVSSLLGVLAQWRKTA